MERIKYVEHRGVRVLQLDFSNLTDSEEALRCVEEAKTLISGQGEKTLLTVTDVREAWFDRPVAQAVWELAQHNKPYVRAAAVVGVSDEPHRELFDLISHMTGRSFALFDELEDALDWLVQGETPTGNLA